MSCMYAQILGCKPDRCEFGKSLRLKISLSLSFCTLTPIYKVQSLPLAGSCYFARRFIRAVTWQVVQTQNSKLVLGDFRDPRISEQLMSWSPKKVFLATQKLAWIFIYRLKTWQEYDKGTQKTQERYIHTSNTILKQQNFYYYFY